MKTLDLENPTDRGNYVDRGIIKGSPLVWRDDMSGKLREIVLAYLERRASQNQIEILIKYMIYYFHAPCWIETTPADFDPEYTEEIRKLRSKSLETKTIKDLDELIEIALDLGIDPL